MFVGFFFFMFLFPSVITCAGCSEFSETIYSIDNGRDWLITSRECTSRNVELNGNFYVKSIFVKLFHFFIFCFPSHFVMLSFCGHSEQNTQAILFPTLIFKKIEFKNGGTTWTFELENSNNLISSWFRSRRHHPRQDEENIFLKPKDELHDKKSSWRPNILFNLNAFSNCGSSNYRNVLIRVY